MLDIARQNDTATVRPNGMIGRESAEELRAELLYLVEQGVRDVRLELDDVDMIDSQGLAAFLVCHRALQEHGGGLVVVTDSSDFRSLFRVLRLDEHFDVRAA